MFGCRMIVCAAATTNEVWAERSLSVSSGCLGEASLESGDAESRCARLSSPAHFPACTAILDVVVNIHARAIAHDGGSGTDVPAYAHNTRLSSPADDSALAAIRDVGGNIHTRAIAHDGGSGTGVRAYARHACLSSPADFAACTAISDVGGNIHTRAIAVDRGRRTAGASDT